MYNYRIYVYREFGYECEGTFTDAGIIDKYIKKKNKDYSRLLVIRHDIEKNMDIPCVLKYFDSITYAPKKRVRSNKGDKKC